MTNKINKYFISRKLYLVAILLLGVFGHNTYHIKNNFTLSLVCLTIGCIYAGIHHFLTLENNVKEKRYILIFFKGIVFYLSLFTLIARLAVTII